MWLLSLEIRMLLCSCLFQLGFISLNSYYLDDSGVYRRTPLGSFRSHHAVNVQPLPSHMLCISLHRPFSLAPSEIGHTSMASGWLSWGPLCLLSFASLVSSVWLLFHPWFVPPEEVAWQLHPAAASTSSSCLWASSWGWYSRFKFSVGISIVHPASSW